MATKANSANWIDEDELNFISLDRDEKFDSSNFKRNMGYRNVFVHSPHSLNDKEIHKLLNEYSGSKSVSLSDSVLSISPSPSDQSIGLAMDMEDVDYYDCMENMMDLSSASSMTSEIVSHTYQTNEDIVDVNNSSDIFGQTTTKSNEHLVVTQFRLKKDPFLETLVVRLPLDTQTTHETLEDTQFNLDDITANFNDLSTKAKLKLNIIRKCTAEGKDIEQILHQSRESSKIEEMPSEVEKAKEDKRKARNRLSAKKSRDLKKEEYDNIKEKHKVLVYINEEKKKDVEDLEKTARTLEDFIHTNKLQPLTEKTASSSEELNACMLQPLVEKPAITPEEFINTHNLHPHINQESASEPILETDYPTSHFPVENINLHSVQDISLNENESLNNKVLIETLLQCCPELRQNLQAFCHIESGNPFADDSMELDPCAETNTYQVQVMENMLPAGEGFYHNQNDWCGETTEQYNTHSALVSVSEHCDTGPAMQSIHGRSDTQSTMVSAYEQYNTDTQLALLSTYQNSQPACLSTHQQSVTQPALLSTQQQSVTQPAALSTQQQSVTQPALLCTHRQYDTHEQSNTQPALWSMQATSRRMCDPLKQNPQFPITSSQPSFEPAHQNVMCKTVSVNQQDYTERGTSHDANDRNQVKIMNTKCTHKVLEAWQVDFSSSSDDELMSLTNSFIEEPNVKKRKIDGDNNKDNIVYR